jgi:NADH:ubiquinone oxidoreductase subunit 6 (subunit J)
VQDNLIGWIFWLLTVVSVAASIFSVTAKNYYHALNGLSVLSASVAVFLLRFGYYFTAVVYVLCCGAIILFLFRSATQVGQSCQEENKLTLHPAAYLNLLLSLFVFAGCLYLISHTDVWQYRQDSAELSASQVLKGLFGVNQILLIIASSFLVVLLVLLIINLKRKEA